VKCLLPKIHRNRVQRVKDDWGINNLHYIDMNEIGVPETLEWPS
jgi:hypothetical protein